METLLTKKEVAANLRVSTRTVCRYVKLGWLKPIRISEQVLRFSARELERFVADGPGYRPKA